MMSDYHSVVGEILFLLNNRRIWYEAFEHDAVTTSEEAARVRPGYTLAQGAKALIVRIKKSRSDKKFIMLVLPGGKKFNTDKVKQYFGAKDIRFASIEEVKLLTKGVESGGVPPFGNLFALNVYADPGLFKNEKIIFNAGDRKFSIAMRSNDYISLVKPVFFDMTD